MKMFDLEKNGIGVGDDIWACAFSFNSNKETKALYQKPVRGQIVAGRTESQNKDIIKRCGGEKNATMCYFVPYSKNNTSLAWYKCVNIDSRVYATTYDECVKMYNSMVQSCIEWHNATAKKLEDYKI